MKSPAECYQKMRQCCKPEWKTAFLSTILLGAVIHMPILISDLPNHDGLDSMYFDQNMITSGRWFLTIACGFSSYYTLPWLIGVLALCFLGGTSVVLTEFLEVRQKGTVVLMSGLLVSFPAVASTFAYVFTMDGYMMALFLAVLAVLLTKKYRLGFLAGGVSLAFSLGTYQSYLPFAALLSIYGILMLAMEVGVPIQEKIRRSARYVYMGILGGGLYFVILQVLLKIQGKVLADYQGINGMANLEKTGLGSTILKMYTDFFSFTLNGNVLFQNLFSAGALLLLVLLCLITLTVLCIRRKWWKSVWFYGLLALLAIGLPVATNIILILSPNVTYHLLMRYQWVLYFILMTAFLSKYGSLAWKQGNLSDARASTADSLCSWGMLLAAGVLVFHYAVADNIAYSNLQKRYEKTYAYCVRLLDRIEQTPGYYQGIPIGMIGVVGDVEYPLTDITLPVTSNMIGMNGDSLLYTGANYQAFIKHYLGATLNILPAEAMAEMYYSEEYQSMDSFPGPDSIRIMDGILYVKTENQDQNEE